MNGPRTTLHVWRVPRRALPAALLRMATDPRRLRAVPGVRFARLLGTGTGTGFGPGDTDLTRYAALVVWDAAGPTLETTAVGRAWNRLATASARLDLQPISSRGRWSGREPFAAAQPPPPGDPGQQRTDGPGQQRVDGPGQQRVDGPVLALTRARLRPRRAVTFWRAIPPVAAALADAAGLLARFGIGEAPLGWQGTVSVWRNAADLREFAYRHPEHRRVIARTSTAGWYAEELFARFAVCDIVGDRAVLGWAEGRSGRI